MKWMYLHIILTLIWVLIVIYLVDSKNVLNLSGNEIGDFFAGVAAPPAFYWLIIGYFLQKKELRLQRTELELQRNEVARLAQSTEQQSQIMLDTYLLEKRKKDIEELEELSNQIQSRIGDLRALINAYDQRIASPKHDKLITWNLSAYPNEKFIPYFADVMDDWKHRHAETYGSLAECLQYTDENLATALMIQIQGYIDFLEKGRNLEFDLGSSKFSLAEVDTGVVKFNLYLKELLRDLNHLNNSP